MRQDQERWSEAEDLSSYALSVEPASGHAAHARSHVFYETGEHTAGLAWLDEWIRTRGPEANHRSHFSWHAALHELMQGDFDAVQRRYARELAPPLVTGSRALVDSGALLWRCHVTDSWSGELPSEAVCGSAPDGWLISPPTPFVALHAALSLAAERDEIGLAALRTTSLAHADPTFRDVVAPVCRALQAVVEGEYDFAATLLESTLPRATVLGGSAAQREVLQDTLVFALARSGQGDRAAAVLDERLSRRDSALDVQRRAAVTQVRAPTACVPERRLRAAVSPPQRKPGWFFASNHASGRFGDSVANAAPALLAAPGMTTTLPASMPATAARATSVAGTHMIGGSDSFSSFGVKPAVAPKSVSTGPGQSTVAETPVPLSSAAMLRV